MANVVKLSPNEATAIKAWLCMAPDFSVLSFKIIGRESGLERKHVRRAVRSLARKGLAEFVRASWTDDGEFRGAGYQPTHQGWVLISGMEEAAEAAP